MQELQPPGYDEWISPADKDTKGPAFDPRLTGLPDDAADLLERMSRIAPLYGGSMPLQAVWLDLLMDTGQIPLQSPGSTDRYSLFSLDECANRMQLPGGGSVRDSFHRLHAAGALLVEAVEDVYVVKMVAGRPERPGDRWIFAGEAEADLVPQVCIPAHPDELGPERFAALGYVRAHMERGTEATAEEYATFDRVQSVAHARELLDSVAHLADRRGCAACPSAHLCTREKESL
ncbi:hypothetical protein ABZ547_34100 [Streptomyces sparsogenes]|uniref:hypothetical protein n=1 Tax=Streptomyces sparsogenes TaxID=67365 RepID=UPI0033CF404F